MLAEVPATNVTKKLNQGRKQKFISRFFYPLFLSFFFPFSFLSFFLESKTRFRSGLKRIFGVLRTHGAPLVAANVALILLNKTRKFKLYVIILSRPTYV